MHCLRFTLPLNCYALPWQRTACNEVHWLKPSVKWPLGMVPLASQLMNAEPSPRSVFMVAKLDIIVLQVFTIDGGMVM